MLLALDCGSTNHKVAIFDENLERKATRAAPVQYTVRDAERVEFEPGWVWNTTLSLIRQACQDAGIKPSQIETIALTSQAQTFTLLDNSDRAVIPFLNWADKRAVGESADIARELGHDFTLHCSFGFPLPQLQLSKVLWLRRHHPEKFDSGIRVISLPSFLGLRLAGVHVSDVNIAGMSGLCSCRENAWWSPALKICELQPAQMGELVLLGQAVNARKNCSELGLLPDVRIVCAGNDQTAGAFGNGCSEGKPVLTLGTALVVYRYAGRVPGPFETKGCWGPYPGGGFYELAACDEGCAALDWAVEQIMPGNEPRFFKLASTAAPGAALFYPQRMYTPQAWEGTNDAASRARAVLEGICFRARQMLQQELKLELTDTALCVVGGGSQSSFWLQILANVLNHPVIRGEIDILLGAAMLAKPGITAPTKACAEIFEPTSSIVAIYEERYKSWLETSSRAYL
jgi:sugar (pentulose or hexulose) kinase